jgi:hypothetical protein
MIIRRSILKGLTVCLLALPIAWQPLTAVSASLEDAFRRPPDADKPWAYWWWLKGNVTKEAITRDLEAMKRVGLGGLLHFDARGYHEDLVPPPESRMEFMSSQWREMLAFSIAEARRLGLQVSVNLSSDAGALKGPWDVGSDAPKHLIWTSASVQGPRHLECSLPRRPEKHFLDVALMAVHQGPSGPSADAGPRAAVVFSIPWQEASGKLGSTSPASQLVDVTDRVDAQGRLCWDVPKGSWQLIRFGYATMEGHEHDVDILNAKAVNGHFDRLGRAILADAGPAVGKTLTHFYSVSWEGAAPTWTPDLEQEFLSRRGYSLRTYLPVLAGIPVGDWGRSLRFLRDYHTTLGELFLDYFYSTLRQRCHEVGLRWHSESGGPWERNLPTFTHADQLAFLARNDMPQGEFWVQGSRTHTICRPIAMAAHVYGRRLAAAEAFTDMHQHWSAGPALLKADADAAFCDGINQFVWHTFTLSLPEFGLPGAEYFAGTHLNPNVTWFDQAGPFLQYLARCQVMLRQGRAVADVCCYTGDHAYLHWGRAEKWSPRPTRLLGKGYAYDLMNTESLLERLSVRDGKLVLPDGMGYRLMVVDLVDATVLPDALCKIRQLVRAGATVVLGDRRPTHAPGLTHYPACDAEVARVAAELWSDAKQPARRRLGRGQVFTGTPVDDVLKTLGVRPDFEGPLCSTHRRSDDLDLYFVAGQGKADCTFRISGKEPEFWDPQSGGIRPAVLWRSTADGRTVVPIELPKTGSLFVVFRKPAAAVHLVSLSGPPGGIDIDGRSANSVSVGLWRPGGYVLQTSAKQQLAVPAAAIPAPLPLVGPWTVQFQPGRGGPPSAVFQELTAWNQHADPRIKYFSGKATYHKAFTLTADQAGQLVRLCLGDVESIARVRLNGKELGIVWTSPWTVELTGVTRPGENQLEIDVTNLWVNRLIGDAGLPPERRITKTNVALFPGKRAIKPYQGFCAADPLLPSGLLGPVRLEFGERRKVGL